MMRRTMPVIAIFMLIGAACAPARLLIPVPSATIPVTPTALPTNTPTPSALLTGTLTLTPTAEPSATQPPVLMPTFSAPTTGVRPTRTSSALLTSTQTLTISPTGSPTATTDLQATGTAPPPTPTPFCPIATAEPFWVDPVTSPTDELSQVIVVRIGNGEEVTVVTESGTFTLTGNFGTFLVEISLLPNIVHHLEVSAKVRTVPSSNGCIYGGYTLRTTSDRHGNPLIIVQGEPIP